MAPVILLADDHSVVCKGLKATLKYELGYTGDVPQVNSCAGLMQELHSKRAFTHLILDVHLSDGSSLEILPNIRKIYPSLSIAILTMLSSSVLRKTMKAHGISYIINKANREEDIARLINSFLQNEVFPVADIEWDENNPFAKLGSRELEILHYQLKGLSTNAIGNILNLQPSTVSTYKARIREKTGTTNWRELEQLAEAYDICF
ncbi:MAG TPA: response regulator transcription factor [Cyclobacteriaceae bacterium]|nr:response regulator transcription factor [Cyclobacteriaceae bacterium]